MAWLIRGASNNPQYAPEFRWIDKPEGFQRPRFGVANPIDESSLPTTAIITTRHQDLPDFFGFFGTLVVCDRFRQIAEAIEPSVNQFIRVNFLRATGEPFAGNFFLLNILQKVDAVVIEESDVEWIEHPDKTLPTGQVIRGFRSLHLKGEPPKLVVAKSDIAGRHLWRGDTYFQAHEFCSDRLMSETERAGLKHLRATKLDER